MLQSDPFIYNGATFSLNSFVTHAFEAREMPGKSGECKDNTCGVGYFTVNENTDQGKLLILLNYLSITRTDAMDKLTTNSVKFHQ